MFKEASLLQNQLLRRINLEDDFKNIELIGGMDISCNLYSPHIYGVCVVFSFPELIIQEISEFYCQTNFPYVPGFLAFREAPALIGAFGQLKNKPDVILVDGQGISHPKGLGIASHIGAELDMPTIGVAKSVLVGEYKELDSGVGSQSSLIFKDNIVATAYRSRMNARPIFISTGHRVSLKSAVSIVSTCLKNYRLPIPTREAHIHSNIFRKKMMNQVVRRRLSSL